MKFAIYIGNPRTEKTAKKLTEVRELSEALNRLAIEKNNGREAYIREIPEAGDLRG